MESKKKRRNNNTQNIGGPPPRNNNRIFDDDFEDVDWKMDSNNNRFALEEPFSCMIDLINNSKCGQAIPADKRMKAAQTFAEVTGYTPPDYNVIFTAIYSQMQSAVDFNSGYLYSPIMVLSLGFIWLGVGFGWFNWVVGIFLSLMSFVVLYGFSVAYRVHAKTWLREKEAENLAYIQTIQASFANSVAYWPQGLFAVACAIECDGDNCWKCNDPCGKPKKCDKPWTPKSCDKNPKPSCQVFESDFSEDTTSEDWSE